MKVLITGITGFVGSHLAELYLEKDYNVFGTKRWRSRLDNILHIKDQIKLIECDITDGYGIEKAIEQSEPDVIHHLAAQSFVPASWANPKSTLDTNIIGTLNILEGARRVKLNPVIQICGSSEEYGMVKSDEIPIKETNTLRPLSPYGVSKVTTDLLSIQYHQSYGLKVVVTRAFNHTGARRGEVFVCSNFAKQIALIEKGKQNAINHGNLDVTRDFTDVRDVVRAYYLLTKNSHCIGKQLNICSGKGYKIREVLDILKNNAQVEIKTIFDKSRSRPSDVPILIGNCDLFKSLTGWKPEIPLEKTLSDLLTYWRGEV
ncbi:MAG: GDP-mannose 4,6-dehydratase [Candidatus Helarchaeota archaeon]|nr:GDP-mannose 4,6-dehydratase [Candidatus Helarchaeota archaeon]